MWHFQSIAASQYFSLWLWKVAHVVAFSSMGHMSFWLALISSDEYLVFRISTVEDLNLKRK